jgi:hypothetical protein
MSLSLPTATDSRALAGWLRNVTPVDRVGVEERVAALKTRSIKKSTKVWALRLAISMCDLTTLEGKDTPGLLPGPCHRCKGGARGEWREGCRGRHGVSEREVLA